MIVLRKYTNNDSKAWNDFVAKSKNGTFLFNRNFMDYHSHRFCDCSLMFFDGTKLVAIMPANIDEESHTFQTHGGLTYGGLIMSKGITFCQANQCFELLNEHAFNALKCKSIQYKAIPNIYANYPAEEDLYLLFRNNAKITARGLSSCIHIPSAIPTAESRKSGIRKARRNCISCRESNDIASFWNILNNVLTSRHETQPVHSIEELQLLMSRFPDSIKLYAAYAPDGNMLAGTLIFDCGKVVHTQYMASSEEGKLSGALDMLISWVLTEKYSGREYLDFGISTEKGGIILNQSLLFQKEGFGARAICYDTWEIKC